MFKSEAEIIEELNDTLKHFPLPQSVIQKHPAKISTYTFGGEENADGINTSNSGWRSN